MSAGRPRPAGGFELSAWLFMRISGLLLVGLAIGHLAIMHLLHSIEEINFAFVAARFTTPFWRGYDLLMLYLALLHGANGMRTIVDDYIHPPLWHTISLALLYVIAVSGAALGTIVLVTFRPSLPS